MTTIKEVPARRRPFNLLDAFELALIRFDASKRAVVLFGALSALLLLILAPVGWNSNEEEYFQIAHRYVAPEEFTPYHAAFDKSNAQFIPKGALGLLVEKFGYERAHDIGRIGTALLYAAGLVVFFAALEVGALDALFIVSLLCLMNEQLVGGEWLFDGVEYKTPAYALLFVAFGLAFKERWSLAILLGIVATYLHFLTGGFWSGMLLCLLWYRSGIKQPPLKLAAIYFASIAPLFVIIATDQFGGGQSAYGGLSADVIYSEIRNPHHVAPFVDFANFLRWAPGIAATLCIFGTLAILHRRKKIPLVGVAALGGSIFLIVAFVISYFDRHTYFFGKFYLFRPSALTLFFALTTFTLLLRRSLTDQSKLFWSLVAASVVACFAFVTLKTQVGDLIRPDILPYTDSLVTAVEANSKKNDIVLLEPYKEMGADYARLHRDIPRPTLVSWKMVPANRDEIVRWYGLIQSREKLFGEGCERGIGIEPKPTLLLVFTSETATRMQSCGTVVWRDGEAQLIKVIERS